jgi:putative DNA primase/helicase
MTTLNADRNQIEIFVKAIFRHAGTSGFVAIRAFSEGDYGRAFALRATSLERGLGAVIDAAEEIANRAARDPGPVNFCPPLAIFTNEDYARQEDIAAGLVITVECDSQPNSALDTLRQIIGEPTVIVKSGGVWVNGAGGEPKLHLHWRLAVPARDNESITKLKQARTIATTIVGGDPTNNPVNHPIRWPGSWHRKAEPRLCEIVGLNADREVELDEALAALKRAAPPEAAADAGQRQSGRPEATDAEVSAALKVIPNDFADEGESWKEWVRIGLATYRSTAGRVQGFALWDRWSKKNAQRRYDGNKTTKKWDGFSRTPPDRIGFGTLAHLADQAQPGWRSLAGLSDDIMDEVLRLSQLSKAQYETERKAKAKQLNMRAPVLDDIVDNLRPLELGSSNAKMQGSKIEFEQIDPWPEAVDGEVLITDMIEAIRKHVILSKHQAQGVSLWIVHTYLMEVAEHAPRLQIKSPTKRCGKTTLLDTISHMVFRPINTESISIAALFRLIEGHHPTVLIDEADTFFKREDGRDNEDMNGILNTGHKPGGYYIRTVGEDFEPRGFKVFGPVAYAWLVKRGRYVADTVEDRSITIELRRRRRDEEITRLRRTKANHLHALARRIARWAQDNVSVLANADPTMPEELNDRAQDNWRPLIAIADAMSENLGLQARKTAVQIQKENIGSGEDDAGLMALADVAAIFEHRDKPGMSSEDVVSDLNALDDRPWKTWRGGQPLTKHGLARLLRPFDIKPKDLRFRNTDTVLKGYERGPVKEAKERYVDEAVSVTEQDPDAM